MTRIVAVESEKGEKGVMCRAFTSGPKAQSTSSVSALLLVLLSITARATMRPENRVGQRWKQDRDAHGVS